MRNKVSMNCLVAITALSGVIYSQPTGAQSPSTTNSSAATSTKATTPSSPANQPNAMLPTGNMQNDPLALYKATGINQAQIDKINAFTNDFQKLLMEKTQLMINLMRDMRVLSLLPDPDEKTTLAKQAEINALNNEMANQRIKLMFNLRQVLTPEQRQKLVQLMQQPGSQPVAQERQR